MKTKIAYISHLDINLYLFRLSWMKTLANMNYDVHVVVPRGKVFENFKKYDIKPIEYRIKREGINPIREVLTILTLFRIFYNNKYHIIHTFTIKPNIYATIAGKLTGVPIIINHITGLGYIYTEKSAKASILRFIVSFMYRLSFRFADRIIFQNEDDKNYLKKFLDSKKARIIKGTGVDINYFSVNKVNKDQVSKIIRELCISKETIVITFIGRLLKHKGLSELIEAAIDLSHKYSKLLFIIVGWKDTGNPSAISKEVIQRAEKYNSIRFLGDRNDVREILSVTNIYVLPSYRDGTPRTVLEAMAMGKPVVTTDVPGCNITVDDGINGLLVPAHNSRALSSALEKLILDIDLRTRMGAAGREKVEREFSNEVIIKQIIKLYEEMIDEKQISHLNS